MKNLYDYLLYYGDTSFTDFKFNDVDALILGMLSYTKFKGIVPSEIKEYIYLEEACYKYLNKYSEKDFKNEDWMFPETYKLIKMLETSKRFYHSKLYHMASKIDSNGQFGALTIRLTNKVTYISYEGTDSTIVGWKDDFDVSYIFPTYSQELAKKYFDETLNAFDSKIYVGGHSKGGNLAMYAYMYGKKSYKKHVITVYNLDGPGFIDSVVDGPLYKEMSNKLVMFIPKDSVIGLIMGHLKYQVVNSSNSGILEHDGFSWECFGGKLIPSTLSTKSIRFEQNLHAYLDDMSNDEKKMFVETLFDIFNKAGITDLLQLKNLTVSKVVSLLKDFNGVPAQTKTDLIGIIKLLFIGIN